MSTPTLCRPATTHPTSRTAAGYVLITTIMFLLIMIILTAAYTRTVRQRRPITQLVGNINLPTNEIVDLIRTTVGNDVPAKGVDQEPYDYPWVAPTNAYRTAKLHYPNVIDNVATEGNPAWDDDWLASPSPTGGRWTHLTNLTGAFLSCNNRDLSQTPKDRMGLHVPSDGVSASLHVNMNANDARLVDATGDGIGDSLWFYPPMSSVVGDMRYVGAVYIEDLSAKINLNTALQLRDSGGAYAANAVLGQFPTDVDLSGLKNLPWGISDTEFGQLLSKRLSGTETFAPTSATFLAAPTSDLARMWWWGNKAEETAADGSPLASPFKDASRLSIAEDELELRHRSGINRQGVTSPLEALWPTAMRSNHGETRFGEAGYSMANYFTNNPRYWLTTLSGESLWQKGTDFTYLSEKVRANPNLANNDGWIKNAFGVGTWSYGSKLWVYGPDGTPGTADDYPFSQGWLSAANMSGTPSTAPDAFRNIYNACLADARDRDNRVTVANGSMGLEATPIITEVYIQEHFAKSGAITSSGGLYTLPCNAYGTAGSSNAAISYCIEFSNPHACPVRLSNIQWSITAGGTTLSAARNLTTDVGVTSAWTDVDEEGQLVLLPGHKILLWKNGSYGTATAPSATTQANIDIGPEIAAKANATTHVVSSTRTIRVPDNAAIQGAAVILYVPTEDASGTAGGNKPYQYLTLPWFTHSYTETTGTLPAGVTAGSADGTSLGIAQCRVRGYGTAEGMNTLQCRGARQGKLNVDRNVSGTFVPGTGASGGISDAGSNNLGDAEIAYRRVSDGYDATLLASLGQDNKINFPAAGRADLKNETLFACANDWYLQGGVVRYAHPDRFVSAAELAAIPFVDIRATDDATNRGATLLTFDQGGTNYTDFGLAHWLYAQLNDEANGGALFPDVSAKIAAGRSGLDALRLPIEPLAGYRNYNTGTAAAPATRLGLNVPFGWTLEGLYSTAMMGMAGGFDLDNADGDGRAYTGRDWFNANQDLNLTGTDKNANNIKDWTADVDLTEVMASGQINLNTMPQWLLAQILPYKTQAFRDAVAQVIVTQRDGNPVAGVRAADHRGLAYIFELLPTLRLAAQAGSLDLNEDGVFDAKDLSTPALIQCLRPLWQMASPRSDFYAAHILVQGYDRSDFSAGAMETKRMLLILGRGDINSAGKKATLLASYEY